MLCRKPIESFIETAIVREEGPLRACVEVKMMISEHSYVNQFISVEAQCPYIKFETEVHLCLSIQLTKTFFFFCRFTGTSSTSSSKWNSRSMSLQAMLPMTSSTDTFSAQRTSTPPGTGRGLR